ncbi:MAG: hypothetical protein M9892_09035 [Bacteroidetes bacterium]|nr:hypothetical protein [Bacteroidota bacterium]
MKIEVIFLVLITFISSCSSDKHNEASEKGLNKNRKNITTTCNKLLPKPTDDFLKTNSESDNIEIEYFEKYFGISSEKVISKSFEDNIPCQWKQKFAEGIVYEYDDCGETGADVQITLPGYCKDELIKFIEWFHHSEENEWNKDKTHYSPKEANPGCYMTIKKNQKGNLMIDYYCGC